MSPTIDADVESNPVGTSDITSQHPTSMTSVPANDTMDASVCSDVNQLWAVAVPEEDEEMLHQGVEVPTHSIIPIPYDVKKHKAEDTESGTNDSCEAIEELQTSEKKVTKEDSTTRPTTMFQWTKTIYSGILLLVCIYVASAAFFKKQTAATGAKSLPPVVAFFMFFGLLFWLALMEGGLNCMVGLQAIDKEKYKDSHKYTYLCQKWVSTSHKLEKFIVGRQFLDLSIVFVSNFLVSTIDDADIGLPSWVTKVFLDSGLAVIVITIVIGQLVSQITAAHCMLDWINNRVFVVTSCVAMTVEATGLLHSVYFIQHSVAWCTGSKLEAKWDSQASFVWYWFRVAFSTLILCLAWAVTLHALWNGDTTMWDGVHPVVSIVMLVVLILGTGILEALQIAMITVVHWAPEKLAAHPAADRTCKFAMHGNNLQAFLIGRQILQTVIMFLIARVMTLRDGATTLLGDNAVLQSILSTGLLGALISTVVASLSWRILAWSFPIAFLTVGFVPVKVCLWIEKTGICSIAWLIADIHRHLVGFKYDEVYLGEIHTADDVKEMHNMPLH
eukprot:scaffold946_cov168-Amphora_coffeaeformis.AAC.2